MQNLGTLYTPTCRTRNSWKKSRHCGAHCAVTEKRDTAVDTRTLLGVVSEEEVEAGEVTEEATEGGEATEDEVDMPVEAILENTLITILEESQSSRIRRMSQLLWLPRLLQEQPVG